MKTKHFVALVLLLAGTNLFTYATARYWTTHLVLTRARERVKAVLEKQRAEGQRPDQSPESGIDMAVSMAGGMYGWWNDGLSYWGSGAVLVISGILVTQLETRKKNAG